MSGNLTISHAEFYRTLVEPRIVMVRGAKPWLRSYSRTRSVLGEAGRKLSISRCNKSDHLHRTSLGCVVLTPDAARLRPAIRGCRDGGIGRLVSKVPCFEADARVNDSALDSSGGR